MKKKKIGIKAIKSALSKCAFDPQESGLNIVFDVNDFRYYPKRAREYILEAEQENIPDDFFHDRIEKSIQLLIWSKLNRGNINQESS